MNKKKQPPTTRDARLKVKKEVLRNLGLEDLTAVAGGLMQSDPPGPCPRSKQSC